MNYWERLRQKRKQRWLEQQAYAQDAALYSQIRARQRELDRIIQEERDEFLTVRVTEIRPRYYRRYKGIMEPVWDCE
jgi:hypothetical protein